MSIKITIDTSAFKRLTQQLGEAGRRQVPFAASRALNETAKKMAKDGNRAIASAFDRPTPRTTSAVKVFSGATKERLQAVVHIYDGQQGYAATDARATSAGKGSIFPARYLHAQVEGGQRVNKRFENALIKAGIMPTGKQAVFATRSEYLNEYGNLTAARINQILSFFAAFPEAGYRANMTGRSKDRLRQGTTSKRTGETKFAKGRKWGVTYFVSVGQRAGGLGFRVPDGIWERNYPNGTAGKSFIKPVLLFIDPASYRRRFDFYGVMAQSAGEHLKAEVDKAVALALRTAR